MQQKEILRHRRGHIGFDANIKRQKQEILIRRKIQVNFIFIKILKHLFSSHTYPLFHSFLSIIFPSVFG